MSVHIRMRTSRPPQSLPSGSGGPPSDAATSAATNAGTNAGAASAAPTGSSSRSTSSITKTALLLASGYCAAWGVYYLVQGTMRRTTVQRRRRKHHKSVPGASGVDDRDQAKEQPGGGSKALVQKTPTPSERKAIEERFASVSLLGRYSNPFPEWREQGAWEFVIWKAGYFFTKAKLFSDGGVSRDRKTAEGQKKLQKRLKVVQPQWERHQRSLAASGADDDGTPVGESWVDLRKPSDEGSPVTYTWIGQSTFLITAHSLNILTDPVFGHQPVVSPFSPERLNPQLPATLQDILSRVSLDVVLITHNHFDHFDTAVVPSMPAGITWVVPKGMANLVRKSGLRQGSTIVELDWWQSHLLEVRSTKLDLTALPAMHWSSRNGFDTNQSLWCSYSLVASSSTTSGQSSPAASVTGSNKRVSRVYFSGDTGYSPSLTRSIGLHSGPFDLAFLPIGSYLPRWHMAPQHVSPADSVAIAKDIGARKAIGMHWGTWMMSDEDWEEPVLELEKLVSNEPAGWFQTTYLGETRSM